MNQVIAQEAEEAQHLGLCIAASMSAKLSLADYQNSIPLIRELTLHNETSLAVNDLELTVSAQPSFLKQRTWRIDSVAAGQRCNISDLDAQLEGALLARLTEAERATVTFALRRHGESAELVRQELDIELLPRNQWGGISHVPEMLAAFVQPNEPAVERLLKQATEVLRSYGKGAALEGYRGGPMRVWEVASAIWTALAGMSLDYALPPASFEHAGQKVRGPGQITEFGLATCLDLTLFFCAALEQAGLNSLVVLTKGHALAGVWLYAEGFSSAVVDDVSALRKRLKLKELVVFETTLLTQRPVPNFSYAIERGAQQLKEAREEAFELAIDVRRTRMQRIKPLANVELSTSLAAVSTVQGLSLQFEQAPHFSERHLAGEASAQSAPLRPEDRLARWQRKLLDLSMRNSLLNFRVGKKALTLEAPDPCALEDLLSQGKAIKLLSRPDLMKGKGLRDSAIFEGREHEDLSRGHALDALMRGEAFVDASPAELEGRLVDLYRTARGAMQEGGANTLFMAMGFLLWSRDDRDGQRYRAPLVLIPVTLNRKSVRSGFTLTLHDDEPRFNPTLIEMLRQDFKLNLAIKEGELPKDEVGLDIEAIWQEVSRRVKDIKGWEVVEDVVVSMFSFAKHLMWKDLTERVDKLRENPVVRHLIDTPRESFPAGEAFPNPKKLDSEYLPEQTFCLLPADSSQLSAVMAGAKGKDFILIGPPGTGKSQTISNLIAQCLAERKRVLFVSEKIAALDVVYRRLREVGLGEFCLELHSNKARKLDVLAQLQRSWNAQGECDSQAWAGEARRLKVLRDKLNVYVQRLHVRHANGLSIHEAIGQLAAGDGLAVLGLSWHSPDVHDLTAMDAMREVVDRLEVHAKNVGAGTLRHPLAMIPYSDWSSSWQQAVIEAARGIVVAAQSVQTAFEKFAQPLGIPFLELKRSASDAIGELARVLPQAAGRDWRFTLRGDAKAVAQRLQEAAGLLRTHRELSMRLTDGWSTVTLNSCRRGLQLLAQRGQIFASLEKPWPQELRAELELGLYLLVKASEMSAQLSVQYSDQVEQSNVVQLQREWCKAEKASWPLSWLAKRRVRSELDKLVVSEGEPDTDHDLRLLVQLRILRGRVAALDIGPATDGVWAFLKTRPELAQCALSFDAALCAARSRQPWSDSGFEPIAGGRCGERMASALVKLRALCVIDSELESMSALTEETSGLWQSHATCVAKLEAAHLFQSEIKSIRHSGFLIHDHEAVVGGDCGAVMAAEHQVLQERMLVEKRLSDFVTLKEITAGVWDGLHTRMDELDAALMFDAALSASLANLSGAPEGMASIMASLERLLGEGNALLEPTGSIVSAGNHYLKAWSALHPAIQRFAAVGGLSAEAKADLLDFSLPALIQTCRGVEDAESRLHAWCAWRKAREQAQMLGLGPLVTGIDNGVVKAGSFRKAFEADFVRWWLNAVVDREEVIREFVSVEHEKRINDFRALDDRFIALTRDWVRASLCAGLPKPGDLLKNSEWGILRHEIMKKKRHMPLRELMTKIPSALTQLTPCLLMSPLSIAQYFNADATTFDVVIFDEASQIPVWEAIGAIARGKQVVMVGDPKQLPPTNFFDRAESDADEEDTDSDLESILDECMGANLPTLNLNWHYRSRHESLIAFSNRHYYGGALVTFPSPATQDKAVTFHPIAGTYEKGGARTNVLEAKAIVADLVGRLKSPGFRDSGLTIGVVTFNSEQQALIEDLLDEERRKDSSIEPHFADTELEPVFVKNLESVQGDERDIMYFSITYGPDLSGAISMNLGPMNRSGGERRLNVAITRARHELRVFSSLKAEQMDLARTQAVGVRDLKHFLEFAERGPRALAQASRANLGEFESPLEEAIAAALAHKGWRLDAQVGASAFRIDLAVVHPDAPGVYLTGIECDGATYHRSATARDRDKLREQVLRGLGWEIIRIWSTDWWLDKLGTLEKVHAKLQSLLDESRARRAIAAERAAALCTQVPPAAEEGGQPVVAEAAAALEVEPAEQALARPAKIADSAPQAGASDAAEGELSLDSQHTDPAAFFDAGYEPILGQIIVAVIDAEGPIRDEVLARRVARMHGWQRKSPRIQNRVVSVASSLRQKTQEDVGAFFWANGAGPECAMSFRRSLGQAPRPVQDVCMEELTALATGLKGESALLAMAKEFGLRRLNEAIRSRLERALQMAAKVERSAGDSTESEHTTESHLTVVS